MGVFDNIAIKPTVHVSDVRSKIVAAFGRSAEIDADDIVVTSEGGKVTLSGDVATYSEKWLAQSTAWSAPGVVQLPAREPFQSQFSQKWNEAVIQTFAIMDVQADNNLSFIVPLPQCRECTVPMSFVMRTWTREDALHAWSLFECNLCNTTMVDPPLP